MARNLALDSHFYGVLRFWIVLRLEGSVQAETQGIQSCGQELFAVLFSTPGAGFGVVSNGSESGGAQSLLWCFAFLDRSQAERLGSS